MIRAGETTPNPFVDRLRMDGVRWIDSPLPGVMRAP